MKRLPRINSALTIGVHVGAGTDAHRVASYNPWVALRWMLDGKTIGGAALRGPEETPTREVGFASVACSSSNSRASDRVI
jgi:predicted amidohydrolase YtcJ